MLLCNSYKKLFSSSSFFFFSFSFFLFFFFSFSLFLFLFFFFFFYQSLFSSSSSFSSFFLFLFLLAVWLINIWPWWCVPCILNYQFSTLVYIFSRLFFYGVSNRNRDRVSEWVCFVLAFFFYICNIYYN